MGVAGQVYAVCVETLSVVVVATVVTVTVGANVVVVTVGAVDELMLALPDTKDRTSPTC